MAETKIDDGSTLQDVLSEAPDGIKSKVANAEQEMLLQYLLGLNLRDVSLQGATPNERAIAEKIITSIASRMDNARTRIEQGPLQGVLQQNISTALQSVAAHSNGVRANTDRIGLQRIRAIAEAVYASLPKNIVDELMRYSMPVALQTGTTLNRHKLFLGDIVVDRAGNLLPRPAIDPSTGLRVYPVDSDVVVIDTRAKFWVENGPFADEAALAEAITGKKITYCGIELSRTGAFPSTEISDVLAQAIARENINAISLSNKYQTRLERVRVGTRDVECSIDLNALVSAEVNLTVTRGGNPYRIRYLGECDRGELAAYLNNRQNFDRFITGLEGVDLATVVSAGSTNGPLPAAFAAFICERLRGNAGAPGAIAEENVSVFRIQRELKEQHQYHTRLRESSDNYAGAAFASSILMRYKDIGDALGIADRSQAQESVNNANNDLQLLAALEKVEAHTSFTPTQDWTVLEGRKTTATASLVAARAAMGGATVGGPDITLRVTMPDGSTVDHKMKTLACTTPAELDRVVDRAEEWINQRSRDVQAAVKADIDPQIKQYEEFERLLKQVFNNLDLRAATNPTIASIDIYRLYDPMTKAAVRANFRTTLNPSALVADVKAKLTLAERAKLEADVKSGRDTIANIDSGKVNGLSGADAQHAVIARYFEQYHGCTGEEAKQAANFVLARTKVDTEVSTMVQEFSDDQFQDNRGWWRRKFEDVGAFLTNGNVGVDAHAHNIMHSIADSCGVQHSATVYRWGSANYRQLLTAYFSLQRLYKGEGVPPGIRLPESGAVQAQMREITKVLTQRHAAQLLKEFGPQSGISEERINDALKDPSKKDLMILMEQFLTGEPPQRYQQRVNDAITTADGRVEWTRRSLKWAAKGAAAGTAGAALWAGKKTASGVVAGTMGAAALGKKVAIDAPVAVTKGVWRNKGKIALIGGASLLGGPLLGAAAWYATRQQSGSQAA